MTRRGSRLSPHRLAKLANALGVSTPLPPTTSPTISTTNRLLLHVIPPSLLADCPAYHINLLRGTLVPLHSTLQAQLKAIAREYALPSTVGLVLYLVPVSDAPYGPRLSDHIWKLLWSRVVSAERSSSPSRIRPLICSPSPSSPSTPSDPPTPDSSIPSLPGLTSPSLLPILAKVEFDIDKRKATWFNPWINSRLKSPSSAPRLLLTTNRSLFVQKDPSLEEIDQDATATYRGITSSNHNVAMHNSPDQTISTKEDEVLEMLEIMSDRSKSRSSSRSTSSSTHSSLPPILPPLLINTTTSVTQNTDSEQSYLAYTEPDIQPVISQGGRREYAVFDDLELEFDQTLDIDEDDPNDRRKSQLIMRAKLDEIERTMAQLSPRMLHSDLSTSSERGSLRVSPTSPDFLSPRNQTEDRSFITSSPPRLEGVQKPFVAAHVNSSGKWPAIPFSMIKEEEQKLPPPPRLALNGVSTPPSRGAPTRPPPPPPLSGGIGNGMTETEKRRRELEEDQGLYEVTVRRDLAPLENGGSVIPLSPDPFGRYPSSTPEPPPDINGEVPETRTRSGTVTTTKSRFSADSGDEPPSAGGLKPVNNNRSTLMSVRTIKKLWRRSKEKEKHLSSGGDAPPPPTPVTPLFPTFASPVGSNEVDKSLPSIPPPPARPSRPSEEQLDFPDISMQAMLPPRVTPSPTPRLSPRPLMPPLGVVNKGDNAQNGLAVRPPSRPSLDQFPSPPGLTHTPQYIHQQQPLGSGSGRRTPQDQLMFRPPSRPSLDQQPSVPAPNQHPSHFRHPSQPQPPQPPPPTPAVQMPMFQGRNPHNGPVTPLLAMHYPTRSASVSQQQKLDMNRLLFDQESPYPVRLASFGVPTAPPTTNHGTSVSVVASPPPLPPQPLRPPSVEPEKPTAMTTMRKSILKWKLTNPNPNSNPNSNQNGILSPSGSTSSSSSSSSTSSSNVGGGAVPRQSFERFERPGGVGSNGVYGHHVRGGAGGGGGGGGGRRPSVINFGSTSSLSSSNSISSNREIPRNPQVPAQYTTMSSPIESKPVSSNHVPFKVAVPPTPNPKLTPSLSLSTSLKELHPTPSPQSLSPSRQSFDSQQAHSPGSVAERRSNASNASSFDMTQFEFVSPVPASASMHGSMRT